jgi:hypothetical protein
MSSQNEAHGDEDWVEVLPEAVREAAIEIICDRKLLSLQLNDPELIAPLVDLCTCIDAACCGDPIALKALTRAGNYLKCVLIAIVEDEAYEIALNRQLNNE